MTTPKRNIRLVELAVKKKQPVKVSLAFEVSIRCYFINDVSKYRLWRHVVIPMEER